MSTLVFQSWPPEGGPPWVRTCLRTVGQWAEQRGYEHCVIGDELFDRLPAWYRERTGGRPMIAADLARLLVARELLAERWERVLWLDADVLVFDPERLHLPPTSYAFGTETWVQRDDDGRLTAHRKVHNALCLFARGNPVLDFLIHATESVVGRFAGELPPTIVGPRLLKSLHNLVAFPTVGAVGSLGPLVLTDVLAGGGPALELLRRRTDGPLCAANLCASMAPKGHDGARLDEGQMAAACARLLQDGARLLGQEEKSTGATRREAQMPSPRSSQHDS